MQDQNDANQIDFTAFIQELEIDKLPKEEQESIFADVLESLKMRVLMRVLDGMPEEQQHHMRTLFEVNPENAYTAVMNTLSPEQQTQMFQEALETIKEDMKKPLEEEETSSGQES